MSEEKGEEKNRHQQTQTLIWFKANFMLQRDINENSVDQTFPQIHYLTPLKMDLQTHKTDSG